MDPRALSTTSSDNEDEPETISKEEFMIVIDENKRLQDKLNLLERELIQLKDEKRLPYEYNIWVKEFHKPGETHENVTVRIKPWEREMKNWFDGKLCCKTNYGECKNCYDSKEFCFKQFFINV